MLRRCPTQHATAGAKAVCPLLLRYMGKGVTKAVENINKHIGPALVVRALCSFASMHPRQLRP